MYNMMHVQQLRAKPARCVQVPAYCHELEIKLLSERAAAIKQVRIRDGQRVRFKYTILYSFWRNPTRPMDEEVRGEEGRKRSTGASKGTPGDASQKSSGDTSKEVRGIIKTVATICHILRLKCTKFDLGWVSATDPAGGAHNMLPQRGPGQSPGRKRIFTHLRVSKHTSWQHLSVPATFPMTQNASFPPRFSRPWQFNSLRQPSSEP